MRNQFLGDGKYLLAFGFLAVFMGNFGQSFYLGSFGASIQASFSLSASGYGLIYSVATLLAGTSLMMVGGYIDKLPLFRFTVWVAAGLFLASLLFIFGSGLWFLMAAFFLVRLCGQGLLPHTGVTTMARCFHGNRGKAISIAASGVPIGEIVLPLLATVLIARFGWQNTWFLVALAVPLIFLPASFYLLKKASEKGFDLHLGHGETPQQQVSQGRLAVLKDGRFWRVLPAVLAAPFIVTGIFIHQSFFMEQKLWSQELFALGFVVYGLVHWLSSLVAGVLVDRYSAVRLLPYYNVPLAAAMLALAFVDGHFAALLMLGLLGMSIGCSGPITGALWAEVYGTGRLGSIRSMTTSFGVWSTSISPLLFGVLIDGQFTVVGLTFWLAIAVLLACVMAGFSYRKVAIGY